MAARWRCLRRDRRGSVAVISAMLGVGLTGFAALAVDVGRWEADQNALQGAADQAAMAASLAIPSGTAPAQQEGKGVAAAQGFVNGTSGIKVSVNIPPTSGNYMGNANAIQVVITQPQQGFLSRAFLASAPTLSAQAVVSPSQASACIMALAPTGNGIVGSGTATVGAKNCNVYVNSTSNCDVALSGSTTVKGYDVFLGARSLTACTSGSSGVSATDKLKLSAASAADPYASRVIPTPSKQCTTVDTTPANITLKPGTYCANLVLSGTKTLTLNSGVYIFDQAGLIASGTTTINGTNVTLVFTSSTGSNYGRITVSGTLNLNLTPMTTGPTAGMAIWFDKRGGVGLTLSGTDNLNITGAVYVPASAVTWSGNMNSPCTQLIASTITFSGSANFQHNCAGLGVSDVGSTSGYTLVE